MAAKRDKFKCCCSHDAPPSRSLSLSHTFDVMALGRKRWDMAAAANRGAKFSPESDVLLLDRYSACAEAAVGLRNVVKLNF